MTSQPQFTLFSHKRAPNGWKPAIILEELGLSYTTRYLDLQAGEQKLPEYIKLNPGAQIPTLIDHSNGDFVVWDSCAIMEYLVEKYDTEGKFKVASTEDRTKIQQWLHFQNSRQGTLFVQVWYFKFAHPEKLPSTIKKFQDEVVDVYTILENVLKESEEDWLVSDKPTLADLSFVMWTYAAIHWLMDGYDGSFDFERDFPHVASWYAKLIARPAVQRVLAERERLISAEA